MKPCSVGVTPSTCRKLCPTRSSGATCKEKLNSCQQKVDEALLHPALLMHEVPLPSTEDTVILLIIIQVLLPKPHQTKGTGLAFSRAGAQVELWKSVPWGHWEASDLGRRSPRCSERSPRCSERARVTRWETGRRRGCRLCRAGVRAGHLGRWPCGQLPLSTRWGPPLPHILPRQVEGALASETWRGPSAFLQCRQQEKRPRLMPPTHLSSEMPPGGAVSDEGVSGGLPCPVSTHRSGWPFSSGPSLPDPLSGPQWR